MSRFVYVNGRYVIHSEAKVHAEDRGYQFADGVYEVIALVNGRLVDYLDHLKRLKRSAEELEISEITPYESFVYICQEVIRLNRLQDGKVYIQLTRGYAPRTHAFPKRFRAPSLVVTADYLNQRKSVMSNFEGVRVTKAPDQRWARPDIKSIALLPNVLGKQRAVKEGYYEEILYREDGTVTETNTANVWIVRPDNTLQTHPLSHHILGGVARDRIIKLAKKNNMKVKEEPFSLQELLAAKEVFLSASISGITPVTHVDDNLINDGQSGPISIKLMEIYLQYAENYHGKYAEEKKVYDRVHKPYKGAYAYYGG
jgi:D-alanine transaminase